MDNETPRFLSEKVFRNSVLITPLTSAVLCQLEPPTTSPGPDRLNKGYHHLVKVAVLLCGVMKYYCLGVVLSSPYCYALLCNNDNDRRLSSCQNCWQRRGDGEPHNSCVGGRAFSFRDGKKWIWTFFLWKILKSAPVFVQLWNTLYHSNLTRIFPQFIIKL